MQSKEINIIVAQQEETRRRSARIQLFRGIKWLMITRPGLEQQLRKMTIRRVGDSMREAKGQDMHLRGLTYSEKVKGKI